MRRWIPVLLIAAVMSTAGECGGGSDKTQRVQNEKLLADATAQTGMPAIKNFRERKLLKDILELRDQDGLTTYTYLFSEVSGRLTFFCASIGYGIPYATQYTNPQKPLYDTSATSVISQADPNGLFSPASADGTWVTCLDEKTKTARVAYLEPRIVVVPFKVPGATAEPQPDALAR
jgi:hypothetical protein